MYIEHYGLLGRPFQLTPDARFYFDSATHKKAMAYLGYGLSQGEGFIVITGEIGSGKTTLVEHLKLTIDRSRLTAIHVVSTQVEGDDMLRSVAQQLGIETQDLAKGEVLTAVERSLHSEARQGRRVLLIVDEAQNLPFSAIEELRMLSNFQLGPESLVQIFLLGQPEFRERLNRDSKLEQVRQRVIATHHLEPIGADEIEGYLVHRLAACGWQGNPDFTPEAVALIHHRSGGVPRLINILAGRVMLHGAIEDLTVIDGNAVRAVIADLGSTAEDVEWDPAFEAPDEQEAEFDGPEYGYDKLMVKAEPKRPIQFETPAVEPDASSIAQAPISNANSNFAEHEPLESAHVAFEHSFEPAMPEPAIAAPVDTPQEYTEPGFEPIVQQQERVLSETAHMEQNVEESRADSWPNENDPTSAESWIAARYLDLPKAESGARTLPEPTQTFPHHDVPAQAVVDKAPKDENVPFAARPIERAEYEPVNDDLAHIDADISPTDIDDAMIEKLAQLEARIEEQDAALRRVLRLLVDWAEDERKPLPDFGNLKGFAA